MLALEGQTFRELGNGEGRGQLMIQNINSLQKYEAVCLGLFVLHREENRQLNPSVKVESTQSRRRGLRLWDSHSWGHKWFTSVSGWGSGVPLSSPSLPTWLSPMKLLGQQTLLS